MEKQQYLLAVEAGVSSTVAVVSNVHGHVLAFGRHDHEPQLGGPVVANIQGAVTRALGIGDFAKEDVVATCVSTTGGAWPSDRQQLITQVKQLEIAGKLAVIDRTAAAVLAGGTNGTGVAITYDTYANTSARHSVMDTFQEWTANEWQTESGERPLAKRALDAVFKADLGLAPDTELTQIALKLFWEQSVPNLLRAVHTLPAPKLREVLEGPNGLAGCVLQAAADGDAVAKRLVADEAESLVNFARVAARRVGLMVHISVFLSGDLRNHPSCALRDAFLDKLSTNMHHATAADPRMSPLGGAVLKAMATVSPHSPMYAFNTVATTLPKQEQLAKEAAALLRRS